MDVHLLARHLLNQRQAQGLRRARRVLVPVESTRVRVSTRARVEGREVVNFCSNDYLGLSRHPRVIDAGAEAIQRLGAGAGASALITGHHEAHAQCEQALAHWKSAEAALLLPSGYQSSHAAIQTLGALGEHSGAEPLFLLDRLAHASLIDAVRATGLPWRAYPHQHLGKLQQLLERHADKWPIVVTESIFSMDGDGLDVARLARLKATHPFTLLVDEAHGSGVYGPSGAGWLAEHGATHLPDMTIVTLSKALGCAGGAICASRALIDAVVNFGRAYLYSTAIPPAQAESIRAAVGVLHEEPWRQQRVRQLAARLREALKVGGVVDAPILPLILHSEDAAVRAAERLLASGLLVLPIRPPTVPRGTSRLRITVSCDHTDQQVEHLSSALRDLGIAGDLGIAEDGPP